MSPAGQGCQGGPAILPCSCLKGGWAPPTKEPIAYCHLLQNQNIIFQDVILILVGKLITCDLPIKKPSNLRLCLWACPSIHHRGCGRFSVGQGEQI